MHISVTVAETSSPPSAIAIATTIAITIIIIITILGAVKLSFSLLRVALLLLYYCFSFLFLGWQTTTGKSSVPKCSPGSDDADGVATTETDCQITIFPFAFLCILFSLFSAWQVKQLSAILAAFLLYQVFAVVKLYFYSVVYWFLPVFCFFIFKCDTDNVFRCYIGRSFKKVVFLNNWKFFILFLVIFWYVF